MNLKEMTTLTQPIQYNHWYSNVAYTMHTKHNSYLQKNYKKGYCLKRLLLAYMVQLNFNLRI